jgi:formate/nitrite transporter FocA (FNT family)
MLLADSVALPDTANVASLGWPGFAANLVPVTLGNIVGGGVMVAAVYHLVYRRYAESRTGFERSRAGDAAARATDVPPGRG